MAKKTIRFPDEVEAFLAARAVELDRSFSWMVVDICKRDQVDYEIQRGLAQANDPPDAVAHHEPTHREKDLA